MLKRLWLILGPVFCALALVALLVFFYPIEIKHDAETEKRSAVTLTAENFKSRSKKMTALTDRKLRFVPFFGSSEWLRFDSVHPAVLAEKYDRNYRPYFLGQRGAASLNQYFGMQQMSSQLEGQTAVYVVSPQWFTKTGYDASAFQQYFNSDQLTAYLSQQQGDAAAQYAARRLLQLYPGVAMAETVQKIRDRRQLTSFEEDYLKMMTQFNQRQDAVFSMLAAPNNDNYDRQVLPYVDQLPDAFSYQDLEKIAIKEAKKHTKSNDFGIDDNFYELRVARKLRKYKDFQQRISYEKSPEYGDLQLVLNQFAKSRTNVIFVIPPVNAKWAAYTGLRPDMYERTVAKIKYQLASQGFSNIADFSQDGDKPYFMQDTIHMGWNGWLAFDKAVDPFVANPQPAPSYQINERFFSKEWAQYTGKPEEFE
ncbi:Poly(glycerophosphate chain) D-alanine transfer protein DltD [Streptococcus sp. DD11]|uniref:D-alanyl-lipoteichoic acid biosynthesis protein DltD n=1 Tax=Streptococcus sp. DD11 TaxID=1777879 RepID=UPI00079791D9|nr:D-alanyl-lipoteichoic acid biosynthesis protein DltD [Streptococcus sp. DD11]KXT84955.1 Poly(glycerophosphate chain) D-alanine transfer protein DltD [Streptococcus sp. DD11]